MRAYKKAKRSAVDEIKTLKELLELGCITPQEFEQKKHELLCETPAKARQTDWQSVYDALVAELNAAHTGDAFEALARRFAELDSFADSPQKQAVCLAEAQRCRREEAFQKAAKNIKSDDLYTLTQGRKALTEAGEAEGVPELLAEYDKKIALAEETRARVQKANAKKGKRVLAATLAVAILAGGGYAGYRYLYSPWSRNKKAYDAAEALYQNGQYVQASQAFDQISSFRDAAELSQRALEKRTQEINDTYDRAVELVHAGQYDEAIATFAALPGYEDGDERVESDKYNLAVELMDAGQYNRAIAAFEALPEHDGSKDQIENCKYNLATELADKGDTEAAVELLEELRGYRDADELLKKLRFPGAMSQRMATWTESCYAVKADGTVYAATNRGTEIAEMLNDGVASWTDIVAVECGSMSVLGLKSDGTMVWTGENVAGECNVEDWSDIVAISSGTLHTAGLKADGTVVAVGRNDDGECNVRGWSDIVAIDATVGCTVGLKSDGTIVLAGRHSATSQNIGSWKNIVAVSVDDAQLLALKSDGTVYAAGVNPDGQCDVSDWTDIVAIQAGYEHSIGLKADGTAVAVGGNYYGQCNVQDWHDVIAIAGRGTETMGLQSDGTVIVTKNRFDIMEYNLQGWNLS